MRGGAKGEATNAMTAIVITVVFLAIVGGTMYSAVDKGNNPLNAIDSLKTTALARERCVNLDNWLDDRERGATDTYEVSISPDIESASVYALYVHPSVIGVPYTGEWDLQSWTVACTGSSGKEYTLVKRDYSDVYDEGFLKVKYDYKLWVIPVSKTLIDPTKSAYESAWNCPDKVKVTLVTAGAWWDFFDSHGTDAAVELCYYEDVKI